MFALQAVRKGTRVIEYTGERVSHRVADRRYPSADWSPHTMLFTVDRKTVIDATRHGSSARWINHSCSPNCEALDDEGRIYIEAIRDIRPGEELTYDYNLRLEERHTPAAKSEYPCHCGEQCCRGTLLGKKR
ncbi:MAG TPA: SET domain-containing protein-lysine N-methyltransferase [Burkholderiales bacterium]